MRAILRREEARARFVDENPDRDDELLAVEVLRQREPRGSVAEDEEHRSNLVSKDGHIPPCRLR